MRDALLIIHFIGLAMGLGTSMAFMFLGIAGSKLEKQEAAKFMMNTFPLARMGHIGITLLVLSGLLLMSSYWSVLLSHHILLTKLVLVLVLAALIGILSATSKKIKSADDEALFQKMKKLGMAALVTGVLIVILAVLEFH